MPDDHDHVRFYKIGDPPQLHDAGNGSHCLAVVAPGMEIVDHLSIGLRDGCEHCSNSGDPFSQKAPCELCKTPLAGNRYPAHGIHQGEAVHVDICINCVLAVA